MLWTELASNFPDKATFVPSVAGVVEAWCGVLESRLEDDKFASWTEGLMEKLEPVRAIKLYVEVGWLACLLRSHDPSTS